MKKLFIMMFLAVMSLGFTACEKEMFDNAVLHPWQLTIQAEGDYSQLKVGETLQLKVDFVPSAVTDTNVSWRTNNTDVATVSPEGLVNCVGPGEATITVCADYDPEVKAFITLKVTYAIDPMGLDNDNPIDQGMAQGRRK